MVLLILPLRHPRDEPPQEWHPVDPRDRSVGLMGMLMFVASLTMFFGATLVGWFVTKWRADVWPPPGVPEGAPLGMWVSTAIIIASSATLLWGHLQVRKGNVAALRIGLTATLVLGVAFLIGQTHNWISYLAAGIWGTPTLWAYLYYVLTILHAVHVIGGVVPMAALTRRAWAGQYTAEDHQPVLITSIYWHFLDALWIVMFVVMFLL